MRKAYPIDISREQFSQIEPLFLSARKITAPRKLDLYDVFCAVLYIVKTACQWRMLPSDFQKWRSVHAYFQIWSERINDELSLLEKVCKRHKNLIFKLAEEFENVIVSINEDKRWKQWYEIQFQK
jgi:transposase